MPHEGQFLSCCAVVTGVMRSLFVVPHPDVLAAHAEDIRAAQQEADADPTTRGHLMKTLHVRLVSAALHSSLPRGHLSCLGTGCGMGALRITVHALQCTASNKVAVLQYGFFD